MGKDLSESKSADVVLIESLSKGCYSMVYESNRQEVESPIFVTGFSQGGTSIMTNLLASHPGVCTVGEIPSVFQGSRVLDSAWQMLSKAITHDLPLLLASGSELVRPINWAALNPIGARTQVYIRNVLRRAKMNSAHEYLNFFKSPGKRYTNVERDQARLLGQYVDGMSFLNDSMLQMYPEAEFVGVIRNGLAVCEGHVRQGKSASKVGRLYRLMVEKMLADRQCSPNFHVIRFEDLSQQPLQYLKHLIVRLGLNPFQLNHVHLDRPTQPTDFNLESIETTNQQWTKLSDLPQQLDPDADDRQIRQLRPTHREQFLREAGSTMEQLGYI